MKRRLRQALALASVIGMTVTGACQSAVPQPAALDTSHDQCRSCRMIVSDRRLASQIVAPYEEPKFFDDMDCLRRYLKDAGPLPKGAVVFVADHRTAAWVQADRAIYTRVETVTAPMGSHVVAHESPASRDADPEAVGGTNAESPLVVLQGQVSGGSQ